MALWIQTLHYVWNQGQPQIRVVFKMEEKKMGSSHSASPAVMVGVTLPQHGLKVGQQGEK